MAEEKTTHRTLFTLSSIKADHIVQTALRNIPKTYRAAARLPNFKTYWLPAMKKQVDSLAEEKVFELVKREGIIHVLPGKWVFDEKFDPGGKEYNARARYVVCGNFEAENWSSEKVYAAVAHAVSVRLFLALMAVLNLIDIQCDFKLAYLNATIPDDHTYYVELPPGINADTSYVWKLRKALYGLRRSALYWFKTLAPVMKKLGFVAFGEETCIFMNQDLKVIILLYIDDLLIAGPSLAIVKRTINDLAKHFKLKEMGEVKRFLGYDILRDWDSRTVFVSQTSYTRAIIKKYGYDGMKPAKTP
jgi:hypothetical protein